MLTILRNLFLIFFISILIILIFLIFLLLCCLFLSGLSCSFLCCCSGFCLCLTSCFFLSGDTLCLKLFDLCLLLNDQVGILCCHLLCVCDLIVAVCGVGFLGIDLCLKVY